MSNTDPVLPGDQAQPALDNAGEGAQAEPSLRDTIAAAFAEDAGRQGEAGGEAAGARVGTQSAPAAEPVKPAAKPADDGQPRNELGQFAKSEHPKTEPKTPSASGEPAAGAPTAVKAEVPPPQAIAPPAAWSPAAKAEFTKLPEVIQKEVLKREQDWDSGTAQRNRDADRLNRLHEVLNPYAERFRLAGINEAQAVQQLLSASDFLERDPVNALLYLARTKGVDPRQLAQVFVGNGPAPPMPSPEMQQLTGEVQSLRQTLQQRDQAANEAQYQTMLTQVEAFAKDPSHVYFENVREPMAAIVQSGVRDLEEAYQRAIWGDPQIRDILLQQKAEDDARAAAEAAKARTAAARQASGSVTGSPTPGVAPNGAGSPDRSLREELEANFRELA